MRKQIVPVLLAIGVGILLGIYLRRGGTCPFTCPSPLQDETSMAIDLPARALVGVFSDMLIGDDALRHEQEATLIASMKEARTELARQFPSPDTTPEDFMARLHEAYLARAEAILTPAQLEQFRVMLTACRPSPVIRRTLVLPAPVTHPE